MQKTNIRNDWSDITNGQRDKSKDEQSNPNQPNKQNDPGKQIRQNNKANQCKDQKADY